MADSLFEVQQLELSLPNLNAKPLFGPAPMIHILKGLDFAIEKGCVTGIVGESGSGKSTLGRCLVRLHRPTGGSVLFEGRDIAGMEERGLEPLRRDLQMIFQDPMSSLNPRHTIAKIIARPLRLYGASGSDEKLAKPVLEKVHLPLDFTNRYPHQLSGGQRQRVGIARAIALNPKLFLADEIVSGLDVSTQAQIIRLLEELVSEMDLTLAFISHDLSVIRRLSKNVIIMRSGEIIEQGPTAEIFNNPRHDYTKELKAAIPLPEIDPDWIT
ncbi:MAG: ABC transporter ATP-binding protein [Rhizobiaceae bacterium]|nr:ABC transporter ATP-binding protein [Rhizobiaceae bacterium]